MTPVLHISTALVYLVDPNSISGALYHLVATYSVSTGVVPSDSFMETNLARPKSANLAVHWEFNKILDGFISLWINLPVCMYLIALSIWYTIYFLWIYSNILALITACKSFIIYILKIKLYKNILQSPWNQISYINPYYSQLLLRFGVLLYFHDLITVKTWLLDMFFRHQLRYGMRRRPFGLIRICFTFFNAKISFVFLSTVFQTTP